MHISNCFYLGYISKTVGHNGELTFKLDVDSPSFYKNIEVVFIQMLPNDDYLVPFFINSARPQGKNLLHCSIDDIDTEKEATSFIGKSLYLSKEMLPPLDENNLYASIILDYKVIDQEKGEIGKVIDLIDVKGAQILSILYEDKEILIPVNEESIVKIDSEKNIIYTNAPHGLIDIYLEP